jgi:hypothetical protein
MAKILQFPSIHSGKTKSVPSDARTFKLEARMAEVESESKMIQEDIRWLTSKLEDNKEEFRSIIKELAELEENK